MIPYPDLIKALEPVMRDAGAAIMDVYHGEKESRAKADGSPVTQADRQAEEILLKGLCRIVPDIPVVSEENAASHLIQPPHRYFLVDPLDGTKEFLRADGKGHFTVNIGLIEGTRPMLGMILVPTTGQLFYGFSDPETGKQEAGENGRKIAVRPVPKTGPVALASRSHEVSETMVWLKKHGVRETMPIGSSLKFCLLARGDADVYPRFSPTMEWDSAAGHAILSAAGGCVEQPDGEPLRYGKTHFKNSNFIARAGF